MGGRSRKRKHAATPPSAESTTRTASSFRGLLLLVLLLAIMIQSILGSVEGRRCRNLNSGLTLVEQLQQATCEPCLHPSALSSSFSSATTTTTTTTNQYQQTQQHDNNNNNQHAVSGDSSESNNNNNRPQGPYLSTSQLYMILEKGLKDGTIQQNQTAINLLTPAERRKYRQEQIREIQLQLIQEHQQQQEQEQQQRRTDGDDDDTQCTEDGTCDATEAAAAAATTSARPSNNQQPPNSAQQQQQQRSRTITTTTTTSTNEQQQQYHAIVLLMGMARLEKALVLVAELIRRGHLVTVVTTQAMPISNHLPDILRSHIPCHALLDRLLHVEVIHVNDNTNGNGNSNNGNSQNKATSTTSTRGEWPCQPFPHQSLGNGQLQQQQYFSYATEQDLFGGGMAASFSAAANSNNPQQQQDAASQLLRCNALYASGLMRKLLRLVTRMNHKPDVMIADATLLAGLLVAENTKLPCLAIVADDVLSSSTLKWTHPHIYNHNVRQSSTPSSSRASLGATSSTAMSSEATTAVSVANAPSWRTLLSTWWRQVNDQIGMTSAFMSYNAVRRRLGLQPRFQVLDFWKTTVLWTSLTNHITDLPETIPTSNGSTNTTTAITENDSVLVDFRAYLYSKTGIGIGTSASKGNSLPLISLPEPAVPPCQPCRARGYFADNGDYVLPEAAEDQKTTTNIDGLNDADTLGAGDNLHNVSRRKLQLLLPYYNHGGTLGDRQRFRKLTRALVLLRDSLVSWPRCPPGKRQPSATSDGSPPWPCWIGDDPEWNDIEVIRLGALPEAFVPSIVKHVGTPFMDAIAEHKSISALILPGCQSSSFSHWMQDLSLPKLCLPEGDAADWNVRDLALRIGRLLRKMEQARRRGLQKGQQQYPQRTYEIGESKKSRKRNAHTLYGTTIERIANVVENMGETRRKMQNAWETGDDMAWDVWLHLGLVRHPGSVVNGQDATGWFRGLLVTFSWVCLGVAVLFMLVNGSEWLSSIYHPNSRRKRTHNKTDDVSSLPTNDSTEALEFDDSLSDRFSSLSFYNLSTWPSYIMFSLEEIHAMWDMIVEEFTEQLPQLDRLVDMWNEWSDEESEQLNLLLFSYFDNQPQSDGDVQSSTTGRQRAMNNNNIENHIADGGAQHNHHHHQPSNQSHHHNGSRHSGKRGRSARKKH